jgi:acetyltransferase (GNAT) family protein
MPASRLAWPIAARSSRGGEHFLALDGRRPVAVASLRVDRDLAWLGGAATRTRWRRRGAQGGLIATRLRHAAQLGCRWAWCETAEPAPGRPDTSRRNLLRHGFEQVGVSLQYVWR